MDVIYRSAEDVRIAAAQSLGYDGTAGFGTLQQGAGSLTGSDWSMGTGTVVETSAAQPQASPSDADIEAALQKIATLNANWKSSRSFLPE